MTRRGFMKVAAMGAGVAAAGGCATSGGSACPGARRITVADTGCEFEREPLLRPFGFKGGYLTNIWQSAAMIRSTSGKHGIGICTHSTLWSDAKVFAEHSESAGNALMFAMTAHALRLLKGQTFTDPVALNDALFEEVYRYGKQITRIETAPDICAQCAGGCRQRGLAALRQGERPDDIRCPDSGGVSPGAGAATSKVASIPLMAYAIPIPEIRQAVNDGYFFMKIKIGQPGTQQEMLERTWRV